jgi:hypothetical protein
MATSTDPLKDKCFACKKVRTGKWALLFGPPAISGGTMGDGVWKLHMCPDCYRSLIKKYMK